MILRARTVLPISSAPIENGAVWVLGQRIRQVGRWQDFKHYLNEKVYDLGEVILLPGLVNAHCHLDYTDMAEQLPPPKTFTDWIGSIISAKSAWGYSEYAHSWLRGAHMLLKNGTTTVGDIEAIPDLLPDVWAATPLRVYSFLEMTGIRDKHPPQQILAETLELIDSLCHPHSRAFLSPHAPYSTLPKLLELTAAISRNRKFRVSTHIAESAQEFEMFMQGTGNMHEWLKRNERNASDCGLGSPVQHVHRCGMLQENLLAVHVNFLAPGDSALLARQKVNVIHCPRSHDYFSHPPFMRERLAKAGVNLCLGTDSLATTRKVGRQKLELNLFEEMRTLLLRDKSVSAEEVLRMATVNSAKALGLKQQVGELRPNSSADIIVIADKGKKSGLYDKVVENPGPVLASLIDGRWAIPPRE
jgi:cytosine/adenosine deaminase-related metal-dependent hydrolase